MSATPPSQKAASFLGILGAFLVVAVLVYVMKQSTAVPPLNAARVQERTNALAEIRNTGTKALSTFEMLDPAKGLVRLTEDRAMELTILEYKNPAAARTSLIERAEKANVPPPKPPEAPSKYE